ncbi:MAG: hypothetical protein HYR51_08270 [Candidatus Rokubacteria bacterium]|nr:hypothetical protein [Candidatus Rokubacteria bacterium]
MRSLAALALLLAALSLSACATGGPAGGSRSRCAEDSPGEPGGLRPLVFVFCVQSP